MPTDPLADVIYEAIEEAADIDAFPSVLYAAVRAHLAEVFAAEEARWEARGRAGSIIAVAGLEALDNLRATLGIKETTDARD